MTTIETHLDSTVALRATLPRNVSDGSVSLLFGDAEDAYTAVIKDVRADETDVAAPLSALPLKANSNVEIKWKITYKDGTVEVLPPRGDVLKVVE
jgi:hypothetical protein